MGQEEYAIKYHPLAEDDIARLDSFWSRQVLSAIEGKLLVSPELFGAPLRQALAGYRKIRVGDYRIIFRIEKNMVRVLAIFHRSNKYRDAEKRVGW